MGTKIYADIELMSLREKSGKQGLCGCSRE